MPLADAPTRHRGMTLLAFWRARRFAWPRDADELHCLGTLDGLDGRRRDVSPLDPASLVHYRNGFTAGVQERGGR